MPELAKNAKRPAADRRAPGVNWSVVSFRRKETSSPSHTLCEHGLIELGAFHINNLRRSAKVEFYPWNPISAIPKPKCEHKKPRPDGMDRARYYQSLLDSGAVETRAELARYLGVSRARVTQVLRRLK
ncbi:MAG TPA: hypothetical protein DCY79_24965 [Planctomycetaceae bacterium]|nr:hypothetical protein [Blastopirellula sp.]HAY83071.1 hypothetical protein [Planctomycetaceae bacterium]